MLGESCIFVCWCFVCCIYLSTDHTPLHNPSNSQVEASYFQDHADENVIVIVIVLLTVHQHHSPYFLTNAFIILTAPPLYPPPNIA